MCHFYRRVVGCWRLSVVMLPGQDESQMDKLVGKTAHEHRHAAACERVLTSIHGLRAWGVFRHIQKEPISLERGKQMLWSEGRWKVHRRRNDSQRTSEIRLETFQSTCPQALRAASNTKRLL